MGLLGHHLLSVSYTGAKDKQSFEKKKFLLLFFFFFFFRVTPAAYGGSQVRGLIRAVAAGLYHSLRNVRSKPHLQPTPQLTAMLYP